MDPFNTDAIRRLPDADVPYQFGQPAATYLNTHERVRLLILRARLDALGNMSRREQAITVEYEDADLSQAGQN